MFKMNDRRPVVALIFFGMALWASVASGQQEDAGKSGSKDKAKPAVMVPAPVPAQIRSAKKVFIAYAGGDSNADYARYSGSATRTYDQFYAAMKTWGHYELASGPADAELVFEISFAEPQARVSGGSSYPDPHFKLAIVDVRTRILLWTVTEHIDVAILQENRDKNFDQAMVDLVNDVSTLAGQPPAIVVKRKKDAAPSQPTPY